MLGAGSVGGALGGLRAVLDLTPSILVDLEGLAPKDLARIRIKEIEIRVTKKAKLSKRRFSGIVHSYTFMV